MDIWREFDETMEKIIRFCNGYSIGIYGYGNGGKYLYHFLRRRNVAVDMIIDPNDSIRGERTSIIHRPEIISRIDPEKYRLLITFKPNKEEMAYMNQYCFVENHNTLLIRDLLYGVEDSKPTTLLSWTEKKYGLDIRKSDLSVALDDRNEYSASLEHALMDIIDNFSFSENDSIFDYGCGKGSSILIFAYYGIKTIGGIEYDANLYNSCVKNLNALGIDSSYVVKGDARGFFDIDNFNYFYFYNPFKGATFDKVISNVEDSFRRNRRKITIIYSNPFCFESVTRNNIFKLTKQISSDFYIPDVDIFVTE